LTAKDIGDRFQISGEELRTPGSALSRNLISLLVLLDERAKRSCRELVKRSCADLVQEDLQNPSFCGRKLGRAIPEESWREGWR
jgi:hypothetical protein